MGQAAPVVRVLSGGEGREGSDEAGRGVSCFPVPPKSGCDFPQQGKQNCLARSWKPAPIWPGRALLHPNGKGHQLPRTPPGDHGAAGP